MEPITGAPEGLFIGVGIDEYLDPSIANLRGSADEVADIATLVGDHFSSKVVLQDADESTIRDRLRSLRDHFQSNDGCTMLAWSGHGRRGIVDDELRLLAHDSESTPGSGISGNEVARGCGFTGANQILIILDACESGRALNLAVEVDKVLEAVPPVGEATWVGILTACGAETVRQHSLIPQVARLLRMGPDDGGSDADRLRDRWSTHQRLIRGDDLCDAVLKQWDPESPTRPRLSQVGNAQPIIKNPLWSLGAPPMLIDDLLADSASGPPSFVGRRSETKRLSDWLTRNTNGVFVVTGSAGTGKTALVQHVSATGGTTDSHSDGDRPLFAQVTVDGLTKNLIAGALSDVLVARGVLPPGPSSRNAFELLGAVERAQEARPGGLRSVVITLDGLDQVGDEPSRVVSELVTPLSRLMPVLVTTRNIMVDVPGAIDGNDPLGGSPTNVQRLSVVDVLTSRSSVIDLDAEEYRDSGWSSIEDFLSATLAGVSKDMRPSEIAAELSRRSVDQPPPFLLARLVADRLAVNPVDTTEPGWATGVVASVSAAIEDLVNESLGGQSDKPAIRALESLALGFGSGLPQQEWLTITNAVGLDEAPADTDDLHDALLALRHYIVEDSEQGEAVYRYAHELVREFFYARANRNQPSEITNLACAEAMVRLITEEPAVESLHAQRYISRYVARAGEPGVALIEGQARFLPDVARARLVMSIQALETGNRRSALDDAESAVRAVDTITDPDRGAIAGPAFAQLALCHQALGETVAAVEAAFRSVDEFATLAQTQAAYITEFAAAANNLATSLLDSDRPVEAVEWASQAVELESQFLDSGGANEYFVGIARNTLAHAYSMSGRDKDAVRESQASVDVLRSAVENTNTVRDRAALALSLESLGTHQAALGDYDAALANTQSAREILEPLALTDPAMQGQLSGLFNDLALRYHDVGDYDNAFETLKLVVSNNGETSEEPTPATVIKVAGALMNQAAFLNDLRRANDAFPIARQAVQLLLTISEDYPGRTRPLATALDNYANALSLQGEHAAALVTTRQSLELFRQARLGNPGVDADIARVTAHYGARLYAAGEISEAIDAAKEAVSTYRRLGATNPRHLVEAAVRLAELSVLVHESGNKRWAAALGLQAVQSAQAMRAQGRMRPETLAEILINATKSALNPPSARYYAEAAVSGLEADGIVDSIQHAIALRNLAAIRGRAGEIQAGLEAINRSITTFERIVRETNSSRERLASALSIRARLHREAKQSSFGLSDVDSALAHYGQLPELTHAEIDECGKALSTAALCVRDLGLDSAEITDRVERCLQRLDSPSDRAWMLISLIDGLPFDHPENPTWISRALTELDSEDRELRMRLGFLARSRRASIPETFDAAWLQLTGEPTPKWMQAPDDLVIAAFECVTTGANYESTTGLLTRHGLLSDTEADEILEEAYLAAPPYRSTAIRAIRSTAKQSSQQDAEDLAATFDFADDFSQKPLSEQVNILQLRKDQLQEPTIIQYLQENAQAGDTGAKKSVALIGLSRSNLEREALQAAKSAVLASGLLERIARDYEPQVLRQASFVLLGEVSSGEMSPELAAVVSFFMGVSLLDTQERENGLSMISSAAELDVERPSVLIAIRERLDGHAQFVEAAGILRKLQ